MNRADHDPRFLDVVRDLESRSIMPKEAPSLERTREALQRLRLRFPDDLRRNIIVAGTNGKGSTSKTLESLLLAAGQRTGLYTSPHLVNTRERIRLAGNDVSEWDFVRACTAVESETADLALTHFEMLTLIAAWLFFSSEAGPGVDYAIFEVGLGGTWDATNAIPHATCVICKLGYDHCELLGSTLEEIARNKFGIVTEHADVIHLPLDSSLEAMRDEVRLRTASRWIEPPPFSWSVDNRATIPEWSVSTRWGEAALSLPGPRGAENTNLALSVFAELGFQPEHYLHVLPHVQWQARMQRLSYPGFTCPVFLSGDHNVQGVESLLEILRHFRYRKLHLLIGIGEKKELDGMMERFVGVANANYWLTSARFRGRTREQYGAWLADAKGFFAEPADAMARIAVEARADDLVVISGSLYLAGDVLALTGSRPAGVATHSSEASRPPY